MRAGASSFGVVVGFKLKTHPAPPYVLQLGARFSYTADPSALPWDPSTPMPPNLFSTFFFNVTWWKGLPLGLAGFLSVSGRGRAGGGSVRLSGWVGGGGDRGGATGCGCFVMGGPGARGGGCCARDGCWGVVRKGSFRGKAPVNRGK